MPVELTCWAFALFRVRPFEYLSSSDPAERLERLFCASVEAFSELPRPSRREISQLEDLAMPLLDTLSDSCLRFVAEKLADTPEAPAALIRQLADMPVRVSAPILKRSTILNSLDLLALVGRHGVYHARAIASRTDLDQRVATLIRSISTLDANSPEMAAETRKNLRDMLPHDLDEEFFSAIVENATLLRLNDTLNEAALSGDKRRVAAFLADALELPLDHMSAIIASDDIAGLIASLRACGAQDTEAFLLLHCLHPQKFSDIRATKRFFEAYQGLRHHDAQAVINGWKASMSRSDLKAS